MIIPCAKMDDCEKIAIVLDKDMLGEQYRQVAEQVCGKCNYPDFPIYMCPQSDDTSTCVFYKCPIFNKCFAEKESKQNDNLKNTT